MTDAFPVAIASVVEVGPDLVALELEAVTAPLPDWAAGDHIDVLLPGGLERQYSLCGTARADRWRIVAHHRPDSRGGSRHLATQVGVGDHLRVRLPRAGMALVDRPHHVFVAGGVGITGVISLVQAAIAAGHSWELHYAARSRTALVLLEDVPRDGTTLYPSDEGARLDLEALAASERLRGAAIYCCGPARMIDEAERLFAERPDVDFLRERFAPSGASDTTPPEPFIVELAGSGERLEVPADRSIADVVDESGGFLITSCREGTCGTCETRVLAGEVDHRDSVLTQARRRSGEVMMPCVSRAAPGCSVLVLDL